MALLKYEGSGQKSMHTPSHAKPATQYVLDNYVSYPSKAKIAST